MAPTSSHPLPALPPSVLDFGQLVSGDLNKRTLPERSLSSGLGRGFTAHPSVDLTTGHLVLQHLTGPVLHPGFL